ncbi:MAG TPA: PIN domain-containing protein [Terriglobales bacterium]|nr:PIN domain-containing protein [Terriglobales bacterium]
MKAFLDTSVLVAAFDELHPHHAASFALLSSLKEGEGGAGAHSLAEIYATLTGLPGPRRTSGQEALLYLHDLGARLEWTTLTSAEYLETLEACAELGIVGGTVYDALLGRCAVKAKARAVYTWNVKHFRRLPPEIARLVRTPKM